MHRRSTTLPSGEGPRLVDTPDEAPTETAGVPMVYRSITVERQAWSPAQLVALGFGVVFLAFGGIALARTGIHLDSVTAIHVSVAGAGQTQLTAYLELLFGALLVVVGSFPRAGRLGMILLGTISLAFGIVVAAQAATFRQPLGIGRGYGIFLTAAGAALLIGGVVSPGYRRVFRQAGIPARGAHPMKLRFEPARTQDRRTPSRHRVDE